MIIGGRVWNPGEMRTTVTMQQRQMVQDVGGHLSPQWTTVATVKAKWVNAHGAEAVQAAALGHEQAATVTVRFLPGMDATWSLLMDGQRYAIVSVDNVLDRDQLLELKVRRWSPA